VSNKSHNLAKYYLVNMLHKNYRFNTRIANYLDPPIKHVVLTFNVVFIVSR